MSRYALAYATALALTIPAVAQSQTVVAQAAQAAQTFMVFQVETPVKIKEAIAPIYPAYLRAAGKEGTVIVQFIVAEDGLPVMDSFKVIRSDDPNFSDAVKKAVSLSSFHPAEIGGKKVRQLVQLPYRFAR